MKYLIYLYNRSDELLAILDKATDLTITQQLNRSGRCDFNMHLGDVKTNYAYLNGTNYVVIRRDDTPIWSGKISRMNAVVDQDTAVVKVSCLGWEFWLDFYLLTKTYTTENVGDMVWDMIDTVQSRAYGNIGITQGVNTTTDTIGTKTYENAKVYESIINLTESQQNIDFYIDTDRKINTYARRGSDKTATIKFVKGVNLKNMSLDVGYEGIENVMTAFGDMGQSQSATNNVSLAYYGRRENSITEPNWFDADTLLSKAQERLRINSSADYDVEIEPITTRNAAGIIYPAFGDYEIGDIVTVSVAMSGLSYSGSVRIYGMTIQAGNDGNENIILRANKVV